MLASVLAKDVRYPVQCHAHDAEAQREQEQELDLSFQSHVATQDDGDGKDDEQQVRHDVANCHGQHLDEALPALAAGIGEYLIVVVERPAFSEVGNQDRGEGGAQSASDEKQRDLVGAFPAGASQALEEFQDGALKSP